MNAEQSALEEQAERLPLSPWVPRVLGLVALALVPWTLWLTFALPARHLTHHYRAAWVGFDVALAIAFAATAFAALRSSRWLQVAAAVTGTLLLCDAWFDVVTSGSDDLTVAVVEALAAELPLAVLCAWIVWDTHRFEDSLIRRYTRRLRGERRTMR
jgi:hypothetical protein